MSEQTPLYNGIQYGFIDNTVLAEERYKPVLLVNDAESKTKVLTTLAKELKTCDEFWLSVAFVTEGGVIALKNELRELEKRGVKGKIIASEYQNFTQPKALRDLLKFSNIELRIVTNESSMHTKGYIFRHGEEYTYIIGSSNLTNNALCKNKEWNVKLVSTKDGGLTKNTIDEFEKLFKISTPVDEEYLTKYESIYTQNKYWTKVSHKEYLKSEEVINLDKVSPNKMQISALASLAELRADGKNKALLISATGTGKTYLSAFDVDATKPGKFLFLIHREQIAKKSLESFKRVMGHGKSMAVISGSNKDFDADYLFATINTMSKDEYMLQFAPDYFDYIVIDEAHRSGAASYKKILEYFEPKFLLGMTATPERTDGEDIYKLFDHNIAYEIRLQDAMEQDMICPFHYFGVTDITVDGETIDDSEDFNKLTADERVRNVMEQAEFYGYSGERVKGLIFCSRNAVAEELSEKFNKAGWRTLVLSGANSQEEREKAIERLEQDKNNEDALDYILSVDIFNEGVDIPSVNQVIMLRPTESAIIFVQQLGRGLRHSEDKDYLVVIDFIGNYNKNFLIPIALSGDKTYNKDNVRRYVQEGNSVIPGCSTIHFDEVTAKRIFESIDAANFSDSKLIKDSYTQLKYKLGKIPSLMDFETYGEIDPCRIFDNKTYGSYYKFLKKFEKEYPNVLSEDQERMIEYVSQKYAHGKRPHELVMLKLILDGYTGPLMAEAKRILEEEYQITVTQNTVDNLFNNLTGDFLTGGAWKTYSKCKFIEVTGSECKASEYFLEQLQTDEFAFRMKETVEYGLFKNEKVYGDRYKDTPFQLYSKYDYEDACRLLDWEKNVVPLNIGGYKYDEKTKTYPVFINYEKEDDIAETIKYEDRFISPSTLIAISKSKRTVESSDVQNAVHADERGIRMELFVRKNKDDNGSKEFYYLGRMHATGKTHEFPLADTTAVEIEYRLENEIRKDLYEYITG